MQNDDDIVIPKDLQQAMAAEAKAEREKDARIVLAEVEKDIVAMLFTRSHEKRQIGMKFIRLRDF